MLFILYFSRLFVTLTPEIRTYYNIMATIETQEAPAKSLNFIEKQIVEDLAEGKNGGRLQTPCFNCRSYG